ncbi:MAG: DNA mismatch repair protein MutH [Epulopiscium sp. Nele67-Bin005]|nr:MAG: DNA mismatch repair protein MutH [Epulopiscium sp. Nele67-Bin005]
MKLQDAQIKLDNIINKPLGTWVESNQLDNVIVNKGKTGQLLELALGLNLSNKKLDFEDGELKTCKCKRDATPQETMAIIQISNHIDDLLNKTPFETSMMYNKISHLLYVPICKESSNPKEWFFLPYKAINLEDKQYSALKSQLEIDYYSICQQLINAIEHESGEIHTSNGKFIQIRTKDSKPYHPIYSNKYSKYISNKNYAFYFKKDFMKYLNTL